MPIYQGNYVAPVWVNNVAPAINDTELLAMSQTIQASQILTGSGAPTQYTSGVAGQRYADTSTTPHTIYKCVTAATDANVWELDESGGGQIAEEYDSTATYDEGDYCIHDGKLYRANTDISTAEAWTSAHWTQAYLADDLASHVGDTANPHGVTAAQTGAAVPPKVGSITLSTTWNGASSPYTQTVTVTGVTTTSASKIDLQPTAAQIASLISDGVAGMVVENNSGTLTVYAIDAVPSAAMTLQVTVTEVTV